MKLNFRRFLAMFLSIVMVAGMLPAAVFAEDGVETPTYVAKVNGTECSDATALVSALKTVSGEVTVEVYGKITTSGISLSNANITKLSFIGKDTDAEICVDGVSYIDVRSTSYPIEYTDLILSHINAGQNIDGFLPQYFSTYNGGNVTYTRCSFPNGVTACGSTANTTYTFNQCTFNNTTSGLYSLWVYGNSTNVVINGGTFSGVRGIKMYSEGSDDFSTLAVTNATFSNTINDKHAIVMTKGESITLTGNTFNNTTGIVEVDDAYASTIDGKIVTINGTEYTVDSDSLELEKAAPTVVEVTTYEGLIAALAGNVKSIKMMNNITAAATQKSGYGKAGIVINAGYVLDGNGYTLTINDANATWDCAIAMRGGEVKNLTIAGAMRGVFMPGADGDVVIDNCVFKNVVYTFNSDAGSKDYTVTIKNTPLNGWTSFSDVHKSVTFEECSFGEGNGYQFCRPYQATTFVDCVFADGYKLDTANVKGGSENLEFTDCTYAGAALSADNNAMFYNGGSVVINGVPTDVTPPTGSNSYAYTTEVDGNVHVWGEGRGNAKESYVLKLYSGDTLIATTKLNNVGGIIDGDVYVTWHFFYPESTDDYWTTTWEEGHPNSAAQPTEVKLYIDGTLVATTEAKMSGADGVNPVVWEKLGGVKTIVTGLSGTGTEANPFLINNLEELIWFRDKVDSQAQDGSTQFAGKYFKLTADIDLAGINWEPIGTMSGDHGSFKGVFDGANHTIYNLNVQQAGQGLGLFARTTGNAEIKNLTLNNVTVKSTDNSNYVGGLVGNSYASTKITNVHVTGNIDISGKGYIGGISGHGYVVMDNVSVVGTGTISSTSWCAGGILGYAGEGATNIMNAHVEGITITSAAGGLGAIVGMAEDNNGTQPISGSNLSAKDVEIKTYTGAYGDSYANYALGYLYGGNDTSILTGTNTVENVSVTTSTGVAPTIVDAVASVNGTIYFDLQSAINAAQTGNQIKVLRSVTTDGLTIPEGATVVLDLNGKTLNGYIAPCKPTSLTISNGSIKNTNPDKSAIEINVGTLTLTDVNIESVRHGVRIDGVVKALINGGEYKLTSTTGTRHAVNISGAANVMIKGGTFVGPKGTAADSGSAVCVQSDAAVTIEGGNFSGGKNATLSVSGTLSITGGTFDQDPSTYVATGYKAEENEGTFSVVKSNTIWKVATKAELADAVAKAQAGDTILLTADIDYGTDQLKLEKAITLDLGKHTLTTRATNYGLALKNDGCIVTNGTLDHAGTVAAIKVWDAAEISDLEIDVIGTSSSGNTIDGIVIQENAAGVDIIKNVKIYSTSGQGVDSGIKTHNCGNATEPVIGSMVNVNVDAKTNALNISAPVGTATGCTFKGGKNGIEIWIKGTYSATLDLVGCEVVGGVFAHDEFSSNPSIANNGTLRLTADDATTGASKDDITLTIARAEKVEGILKKVMDNAQAKVNDTYYATLAEAIAALKDGDTLTIFAGEISEGTIKFPAALKNVTIKGAADHASILKNMTLMAHDGSNIAYEGITFDGIVFDNSNILFSGQRASASFKDWTITNCTFKNVARGSAAISFNLNTSEAMENFTFTNNVIDGVTGGNYSGLVLRASKGKIDVTNNDIKNVAWNAIQLINSTAETLTVTGNSFASGADEGILNLAGVTATALTIKNNKFLVTEGQPGVCYITAADVSENYWGGNAPANLPAGVVYTSYYEDEALTKLVTVSYVAEVNDTKYTSLQAAIDKAQNNDTITFLTDITENVTISKNLTIDGAEKVYTGTMTANAGLTVTVQNVNFVNGGFAKTTKSTTGTYTIKNCTFVDDGAYNYSFIFKGANEITIEDCTVKGYKYSFLYITAGTNKVSVKNVTVEDCPNYAVYFASGVNSATIENLTVKNSDNGFVINNTANRALTIKNCTMENVTTAINHSKGTNAITCTVLGVNDFGAAATSEYAKYVLGATDATLTASNGLNVTSGVDGYEVKYAEGVYKLVVADPAEGKVAKIGETMYETLAEALTAAVDGETITLIWAEGDDPIAMNGEVYGKTVTITGTATVDWSKGFLFVGRGGEGHGTVIFDNANLTSASDSSSYGIHVSGRQKNTTDKYDGTLIIKNSTIELDYLINRGTINVDNSTLTVKNGFGIAGRPASETESGKAATATVNITNSSYVTVLNHNGMGVGVAAANNEGYGVLNLTDSTFECASFNINGDKLGSETLGDFNVYGKSTLKINTLTGREIDLHHNAIIKDSTVGGEVMLYGKVTFRGDNKFGMLSDFGTLRDYYGTTADMEWSVEAGASVTLTDKARYGLGYGDKVTIFGSLNDALKARDTLGESDIAVFMHGLVAQESTGWNKSSSLTVKDAYVVLGSNNSFGNKPGNYGGTYTFEFDNVVLDSSRITFYEAGSTTKFTFNKSDVKVGTFMTRDPDSVFTLTDTKLVSTTTTNGTDEGNYHAGTLVLTNSSLSYEAPLVMENGTLTLGAGSSLTADSIIGTGKIIIDATGMNAGKVTTIDANASGFTGTIEVIKNDKLTAKIDENGDIVLVAEVVEATIKAESATLLYEDMIQIRYKFSVVGEDIAEYGMYIFTNKADADAHDASKAVQQKELIGYTDGYYGYTDGIAAKEMGDSQFVVGYLKLNDGTYIYGNTVEYSPKIYAKRMIAKDDTDAKTIALCNALMNYGAAAQVKFEYKTDDLMNAGFDTVVYDESVLGTSIFSVDTTETNGFTTKAATLLFEGAITYRLKYSATSDISNNTLYLEYTVNNETNSVEMQFIGGSYYAYIAGFAPKDMDEKLEARPYYLDANNNKVYGAELVYSGYEYARRTINNQNSEEADVNLAKAFAMYVHYTDAALVK